LKLVNQSESKSRGTQPLGYVLACECHSGKPIKGAEMPEEFNDDQNDNAQSGGGLRKQLEQALEALKTQKEELAKFQARDRTDTVRGLLKAKGARNTRTCSL
jgi:hypothetical protein